jgi:filamin
MSEESNETWVSVQKKTFTRWANQFLAERVMKINDLQEDLKDGVKLCNLLEIISSKSLGQFNKKPQLRYHFLENNGRALQFIKDEGLTLVGIGPEDIVDGKLKLDLGLMWTIILRYHINVIGKGSPKWELLQWVRQQVEPYSIDKKGDHLKNFTTDWQDGTVLFALADSLKPGVLTPTNMSGLTRKPLNDAQKAMHVSEQEYQIPQLLDAADLVNNPDELSLMTYISYFRDYSSDDARRRREEAERRRKTADPAQCYAHGPGLEPGVQTNQDAVFTIQSVNCNGDPLPTGGCEFTVDLDGPGSARPNVRDNNDGTYTVTYRVDKAGKYKVGIRLAGQKGITQLPQGHPGWGQHIKNSPYSVDVQGPSAGHSYATGPGVEGARTGHPAPFRIHSVGSDGKPKKSGGDPFRARVSGPQNVGDVQLKDNGDGTYDGVYQVATPGHYQVEVTLDGAQIKNSPYKLLIENANAGKSWAEGPGLQGGQQGKEGVFTIHSVDADGKPVKTGGDPFQVKIRGPEGNVNPNIKDNNDGTYTVRYTPQGYGDYNIDVTLHDTPIKDAPFRVSIKSSPNAGKSFAEGPGLHEAWDNEPAFFTIHSIDNDGKPRREGGDPFKVNINGPKPVKVDVKDNNDGTYLVTYQPDVPGDYTINVDLEGKPIKDAPFRVKAKAGTDADNSGFGIFSFTLQARDKRGQNKTFGGDKFDVKISGPSGAEVEVNTMDNGDGTYTAIYALEVKA